VDQRRHRGRAFHRVEQPGLQRHLRDFRTRRAAAAASAVATPLPRPHRAEDPGELHGADSLTSEDGQGQAGVADPVDDERLLRATAARA